MEAVINEWVIKDLDTGLFGEEVMGGKIKWGNLERARRYSRANYAQGSLHNYIYNQGLPIIPRGNITIVKLLVTMTEVQ